MSGETEIDILLKNMNPEINDGEYVFCSVNNKDKVNFEEVVAFIREKEGLTIIVEKNKAISLGLDFRFISSWITLNVYSSLDAIGFNSIISKLINDMVDINKVDFDNIIYFLKHYKDNELNKYINIGKIYDKQIALDVISKYSLN